MSPDPTRSTPGPSAAAAGQAKHLVFIYLDDAPPMSSFADWVNYDGTTNPSAGALFAKTPVMDGLAKGGVRFFGARNSPVCSPGRASFLTGVYPFRHGVGSIIRVDRGGALKEFLDPGYDSFQTLPQALGDDVHTGIVGKIHLSEDSQQVFHGTPPQPGSGWAILDRIGFDWTRTTLRNVGQTPVPGSLSGSDGSYYRYYANTSSDDADKFSEYPGADPYNTTWIVDQGIEFLSSIPAGKRAFLYMPMNATHGPFGSQNPPEDPDYDRDFPPLDLVATQEYTDHKDDATIWPTYMAMLEAVDKELGRLLTSIPEDVRKQTTFVIMCDNGIEPRGLKSGWEDYGKDYGANWTFLFEQPESRLKSSVYHWGTNVQLIWNGPTNSSEAVADPGRSTLAAVDIVDLPVTIAEYFGKAFPPCDGLSFLDVAWNGGDHLSHGRIQNYSEHFFPCGDRFGSPLEKDDLSLWRWLLTDEYAVKGRFSFVCRKDRHGNPAEEVYHLNDVNGDPVDLFEREPLDVTGEYAPHYRTLKRAIQALHESTLPSAPPDGIA